MVCSAGGRRASMTDRTQNDGEPTASTCDRRTKSQRKKSYVLVKRASTGGENGESWGPRMPGRSADVSIEATPDSLKKGAVSLHRPELQSPTVQARSVSKKVASTKFPVGNVAVNVRKMGNKALSGAILLFVVMQECARVASSVFSWPLMMVFVDLLLQCVFVCALSVLFFQLTLLSHLAGAVRSRSPTGSCRYQAMNELQRSGFDFLHKAICCVSFWAGQAGRHENHGGGGQASVVLAAADSPCHPFSPGDSFTIESRTEGDEEGDKEAVSDQTERLHQTAKRLSKARTSCANQGIRHSTPATQFKLSSSKQEEGRAILGAERAHLYCSSPQTNAGRRTLSSVLLRELRQKMSAFLAQPEQQRVVTQGFVWDLLNANMP